MDTLSYKTKSANKATVQKEWVLVDATDLVLGRFSSEVAKILRGKHKPSYTPHVDCGDNVVIVNADKVKLTGQKWDKKEYVSHSDYPGGQKRVLAKDKIVKKPTFIVENAVRGMLPKNTLGRDLFRNLFVYAGSEHPHEAQQPKKIEL